MPGTPSGLNTTGQEQQGDKYVNNFIAALPG